MADLDTAIRARLVADGAVSALVGTRIYPIRAPDNPTLPMLTYQRISNIREHVMTGEQAKFTTTLFQIDVWAKESGGISQARSIAAAIRSSLDDFRGIITGIDVQGILSDNEWDTWDEDTETFRITLQFRIMHRE